MRRFLGYIAIVLTVTAIILLANDLLNRYLVLSSPCSYGYKMYRLFRLAPEDEIPILGSSRAEVCFAPKELAPNAFSYGQARSKFRETVFQLKSVLARRRPGVIIVNLDPWGFYNERFFCDYRFAADVDEVKGESRVDVPFSQRCPGLRFYGDLRRNLTYGIQSGSSTKVMENGAILARRQHSEMEWKYIIEKMEVKQFLRDRETEEILRKLLLDNEMSEIVFVVMPCIKQWWSQFSGNCELLELERWLMTFKHVHVIDLRELNMVYDLSDFTDEYHLNEQGARKATRCLRAELIKRRILKSCRQER